MPAAGDLTTVLSLEDFEYLTGLRDAATETEKFANSVTKLGEKASTAAGKLKDVGGGALKDTFSGTVQDFAKSGDAIEATRGAVQAVSGAITGVISKLGPWGFALGTIGGVLADQLIPKFFDAIKAADELSGAIAKNVGEFEKMEGAAQKTDSFARHLKRAARDASPDAIQSEIQGREDDAEDLKKSIQRRQTELRNLIENGPLQKGGIGWDPLKNKGNLFGKNDILNQDIEVRPGVIGEKGAAAINDLQNKLKEDREALEIKERGTGLLKGILPEARQNQFQRDRDKADAEQAKKDEADLDRIREKHQTPQEKLAGRLNELATLGLRNPGNDELLNQGFEDALKEFQTGLPGEKGGGARLAGSAQQGSAAAFSAVNRAIAQSQGTSQVPNQQLAEAKRQVELAKDQLDELKRANGDKPVPVQLAGG